MRWKAPPSLIWEDSLPYLLLGSNSIAVDALGHLDSTRDLAALPRSLMLEKILLYTCCL